MASSVQNDNAERENHKIVSDSSKEKRGKYYFSPTRRKLQEAVPRKLGRAGVPFPQVSVPIVKDSHASSGTSMVTLLSTHILWMEC